MPEEHNGDQNNAQNQQPCPSNATTESRDTEKEKEVVTISANQDGDDKNIQSQRPCASNEKNESTDTKKQNDAATTVSKDCDKKDARSQLPCTSTDNEIEIIAKRKQKRSRSYQMRKNCKRQVRKKLSRLYHRNNKCKCKPKRKKQKISTTYKRRYVKCAARKRGKLKRSRSRFKRKILKIRTVKRHCCPCKGRRSKTQSRENKWKQCVTFKKSDVEFGAKTRRKQKISRSCDKRNILKNQTAKGQCQVCKRRKSNKYYPQEKKPSLCVIHVNQNYDKNESRTRKRKGSESHDRHLHERTNNDKNYLGKKKRKKCETLVEDDIRIEIKTKRKRSRSCDIRDILTKQTVKQQSRSCEGRNNNENYTKEKRKNIETFLECGNEYETKRKRKREKSQSHIRSFEENDPQEKKGKKYTICIESDAELEAKTKRKSKRSRSCDIKDILKNQTVKQQSRSCEGRNRNKNYPNEKRKNIETFLKYGNENETKRKRKRKKSRSYNRSFEENDLQEKKGKKCTIYIESDAELETKTNRKSKISRSCDIRDILEKQTVKQQRRSCEGRNSNKNYPNKKRKNIETFLECDNEYETKRKRKRRKSRSHNRSFEENDPQENKGKKFIICLESDAEFEAKTRRKSKRNRPCVKRNISKTKTVKEQCHCHEEINNNENCPKEKRKKSVTFWENNSVCDTKRKRKRKGSRSHNRSYEEINNIEYESNPKEKKQMKYVSRTKSDVVLHVETRKRIRSQSCDDVMDCETWVMKKRPYSHERSKRNKSNANEKTRKQCPKCARSFQEECERKRAKNYSQSCDGNHNIKSNISKKKGKLDEPWKHSCQVHLDRNRRYHKQYKSHCYKNESKRKNKRGRSRRCGKDYGQKVTRSKKKLSIPVSRESVDRVIRQCLPNREEFVDITRPHKTDNRRKKRRKQSPYSSIKSCDNDEYDVKISHRKGAVQSRSDVIVKRKRSKNSGHRKRGSRYSCETITTCWEQRRPPRSKSKRKSRHRKRRSRGKKATCNVITSTETDRCCMDRMKREEKRSCENNLNMNDLCDEWAAEKRFLRRRMGIASDDDTDNSMGKCICYIGDDMEEAAKRRKRRRQEGQCCNCDPETRRRKRLREDEENNVIIQLNKC